MIRNLHFLTIFFFGFILSFGTLSTLHTSHFVFAQNTTDFNKDIVRAITEPALVRIIAHQKGEITIPAFDIDIERQSLIFLSREKPLSVPIDEYLEGSGFVVHPDGYIITNSHIVSGETQKRIAIANIFLTTVVEKTLSLNPTNRKAIETLGEEGLQKFFEKIVTVLLEKTSAQLSVNVSVVKQDRGDASPQEVFANGYPAEIKDKDEKYWENDRDVALIWIKETRLPVLDLADTSEKIKIGDKLYVFGFSEETNVSNKPNYTIGTVSTKGNAHEGVNLFTVTTENPPAFSGGPLVDGNGNVVALITLQSDSKEIGVSSKNENSEIFAIPSEIIKDMLRKHNLALASSLFTYRDYFLDGYQFLKNKRCQKAIDSFENAKDVHSSFSVDEYINPYIKQCETLIANGGSIDTPWQEWKEAMTIKGYYKYIVASIVLIPVLIFSIIVWLILRFKRKKKMWENARRRTPKDDENGITFTDSNPTSERKVGTHVTTAKLSVQNGLPPRMIVDPRLIDYIKNARASGMSDAQIVDELLKVGWDSVEVTHAFERVNGK